MQVGNEAIWREYEDSVKRALLIVDPSQRIRDDGYLIAWQAYTTRGRRSQYIHLQVFIVHESVYHDCRTRLH